uniref:Uncharacterized protein n=1 Tax=Aegilops tauschii subsp. strangulata TaxID=200361 RepID=A0A453Q2X8_AEGTS
MITLKFNMCLRACLRVSCQLLEQRAMICNAVAIAEIMDATLILPVLKQDHMKRPDGARSIQWFSWSFKSSAETLEVMR